MILLIDYLFFAVILGCFAWFLWKCIGSPSVDDVGNAVCYNGMIFSFFGQWLCKKYNAKEAKIEAEKRKLFEIAFPNANYEDQYTFEQIRFLQEFEHQKPLNFYKALGVCLTCFTWWVSMLGFLGCIIFSLPSFLASIFIYVFMPPISVVVANLIAK